MKIEGRLHIVRFDTQPWSYSVSFHADAPLDARGDGPPPQRRVDEPALDVRLDAVGIEEPKRRQIIVDARTAGGRTVQCLCLSEERLRELGL